MKNKHRRIFKLKCYPPAGGLTARIDARDRLYFLLNPLERIFLRQAITGEFENDAVRFVLVRRGQTRVPLTIEETRMLADDDFFRRVSGE